MNNLPRPGFSAIDVGDAMLNGDLVSAKLNLSLLDPQLVCHVADDPDEFIPQFNLPVCGPLRYLFPCVSNFVPPDLPTADRVHGCYSRAVRPDLRQWASIPIEHAVQRCVELS